MGQQSAAWSHTLVLPDEPASPGAARQFVGARLAEHGLWYLVDDVRLAVSELATNAMLHARTPFTVTLKTVGHSVVLHVQDGDPEDPVLTYADPLDTGGRGLSIVAVVSSDWGVAGQPTGAKSVWAAFPLRAVEPGPG